MLQSRYHNLFGWNPFFHGLGAKLPNMLLVLLPSKYVLQLCDFCCFGFFCSKPVLSVDDKGRVLLSKF